MATTGVWFGGTSVDTATTARWEQFFGVNLGNYWAQSWDTSGGCGSTSGSYAYPSHSSIIRPYVPSDNRELVKACQETYKKYFLTPLFNETGALFHFHRDALSFAFVYLHPKDLVNFSEVDKCCYLATKTDAIWENQLKKLLPNTQIMSMQVCGFSPEHQFKIIFKRINNELTPYIAQFEKNNALLRDLRGPNGMDGEIDRKWKEYEQLGVDPARQRFESIMNNAMNNNQPIVWGVLEDTDDPKAALIYGDYTVLNSRCIVLAGNAYDGSVESFDPNSQQGRCLRVINEMLVAEKFNHQDEFEIVIQASEALKNYTSQNNDEVVLQGSIELDSGRSEVEDATTGFAT